GPLGMKRELRALDSEVTQLEQRAAEIRRQLDAINADLRAAEQSLEEVPAQQRTAERNVFAAKHRHEQTQGELARLGLDLTGCQNELVRIRQDVDNARLRAERGEHPPGGG